MPTREKFLAGIVACLLISACKPDKKPTPPPANATPAQVSDSGAFRIVAVGDIAVCGAQGDEQTAALTDSIIRADDADKVRTEVLTLGDNAYPAGLDRDFVGCFAASWGLRGRQIIHRIHPSIGNHDYQSERGAAYYRYFGGQAGYPFKGYYSFDAGKWHLIALNSETVYYGTDQEKQEQEKWLADDLKTYRSTCTLAYWHRPLFSSGVHGQSAAMRRIWDILYANNVDLVLSGHDHHYERFLPQTPAGVRDSLRGITEIVAGTGGGALTGVRSKLMPNSAARVQGRFGVLVLTLGETEYRSEFLEVGGRAWDLSGGRCH